MSLFRRLFSPILLIALLTAAASADDVAGTADTSNAPDPPGRVARLQYMNGQVSVQPNGTEEWVQGSTNRPLTNSDNVWADKDSRAELSLGTGLMRIGAETSLTLTNVDTDSVQVSLHQGALNVRVRQLDSNEVWEVDTPNLAFTLTKSGDYRFDVDPNGDKTVVTVWKGEGEASGQGPTVQVRSGEQVQFSDGNSLAHETLSAPRPDGFDQWCRTRDQSVDQSVSARYVARGTVGYEDLDEYGTWRQTPEYGAVWVPTSVSPGWAPYSYGHWGWVDPWGWTWIDDYPWGFAPFHYGRWVSWGGYWGWAPGPYWVRPWYSPALVAWWGGPRWGFGFGFGGGFGWCPLGFGEPFFPWYHVSRGYFRNVNISNTRITNITNVTNHYFNHRGTTGLYGRNGIGMPRFAAKPGAFHAVSRSTLERGLPVHGSTVRVSANDLRGNAGLSRINATPTRQARLGPSSSVARSRPSSSAFSRPTVSASSRSFGGRGLSGRGTGSPMARGGGSAMNRGSDRSAGSMSSIAPGGHFVPRPPQNMSSNNFGNRAANNGMSRSGTSEMAFNRGVPRPSQGGMRSPAENSGRFGAGNGVGSRFVPRPPASFNNHGSANARNMSPSFSQRSADIRPRGTPNSVPRPTGRVMPAPRSYSNAEGRGYPSRSFNNSGGPSRSYRSYGYGGASRSYNSAENRGYSGRSYGGGGFRSSPNYGGSNRGYSMPRSGGSYGGGRGSYSAPSHSSGGSGGFHGGGGGGFHGGGGSHGGGRR